MRMLLKGLEPHTLYILQMRTTSGERYSDWSQLFELHTLKDENPPAAVTNLSGTMSEGNLSLFWEAPTTNADGTPLKDLKDYRVTIQPNPADPNWRVYEFFVETNRADFPKELNTASFGKYRPSLTITVEARDLVGNRSAVTTLQKVKARPNPPTALTWANIGNAFSGSWTPPTANTDGTPFDDPDGFQVKVIYAATNIRTYVVPVPKFDYSYEQNKADFGGLNNTAKTPLTLEVRARDSVGQLSDPISLEAGNPPPAKPTGVTATQVSDGIRVVWDANPDDDLKMYEIWSAGALTTAGTLFGRVSPSQREYIHQTVAYNQDHYLYVTAVDEFDSRSPESDRSGPVRPKSPFTVDTTPPAATTLTTATPARASTDPAAVALTWTAVADSDLAGYHIRYSKNTATREWLYHDVIDKAATTTTIEGLASNTAYVFQIRSYDTMINPSAWSAEVLGTSSVSTLKEIGTDVQIVAGGVLRSANFNETNQTGWRLMDSGLDILSGRVNARVVSAGTLISSQTVNVDGTVQPSWSLNLAGNASLNNVQVRGKIVVGTGGATGNAAVNIASHNYGGTGSQWAIKGDGSIDLKAGATDAAGAPIANSLHISSSGIIGRDGGGNQRFIVNTSGQFLLATTNGGVVFDDNGLRIYSGATVMVDLNRNGNATFAGTVRASAGHVGNWSIDGLGIYGGSLAIRSDLGMIYGGDTTARVAMRAGYGFWAGNNDHGVAPFRVHTNGYLYSVSGQIGGFEINGASGLYAGGGASRVMMQPGAGFWAGADARDSSPWYVRQDGYMYARSARVDGTIYASGGDLGNLNVSGTLTGGTLSGSKVVTGSGAKQVQMGPSVSFYGGTDTGLSFGGRGFMGNDLNGNWRFINYDGLALTQYTSHINGSHYFATADGTTGNNFYTTATINGQGITVNFGGLNLGDRPVYIRGYGDANHTLAYGGANGDGPVISGYSYFGVRSGRFNAIVMRLDADGNLFVRGSGNFNQSTQRGKKNIKTLPATKGVETIKKFRPVEYERTDGGEEGKILTGVIAEEVAAIAPELVLLDKEGIPEAVNYAGLTPYLIKAVQELSAEVAALKSRLPPQA